MNRHEYDAEIIEMSASLDIRDRDKFLDLLRRETQNPVELYGWNVWLGYFGIDRFLVGDVLAGILKLLTLGGLGFWVIIDCFLIGNRTRQRNIEKIRIIYNSIQKRRIFQDE